MPPGLMSRRKSRHMVWEMGNGKWGMGIGEWGLGIGESGMGNRNWEIGTGNRKVLPPEGERGQPIIPIAPPEPL